MYPLERDKCKKFVARYSSDGGITSVWRSYVWYGRRTVDLAFFEKCIYKRFTLGDIETI